MTKFHGQPGPDLGTGKSCARGREKTLEPIFVQGQRRRKLKEDAREPRTQRREFLHHLIKLFFTSDKPLAVRDRLAGLEREGEVRGHGPEPARQSGSRGGTVKRQVDFDGVKPGRVVTQPCSRGKFWRIENALPIGVGKAGGSDHGRRSSLLFRGKHRQETGLCGRSGPFHGVCRPSRGGWTLLDDRSLCFCGRVLAHPVPVYRDCQAPH